MGTSNNNDNERVKGHRGWPISNLLMFYYLKLSEKKIIWGVLIFFLFFTLSHPGFSQPVLCGPTNSTAGGSVRLTIVSGGSVDFVFNSIASYKNGITTPANQTKIGISVTDDVGGTDYKRWELNMETQENIVDGVINGADALNPGLPLKTIEVSAAIFAGCGTCNVYGSPWHPLLPVGSSTLLADGTNHLVVGGCPCPPGDEIFDVPDASNLNSAVDQIGITYRCGVGAGNSLLGYAADYYADVSVVFILCME